MKRIIWAILPLFIFLVFSGGCGSSEKTVIPNKQTPPGDSAPKK